MASMAKILVFCSVLFCIIVYHPAAENNNHLKVLQLTRPLYRYAYDYPLPTNELRRVFQIANQIREIQNSNQSEWRLEAQRVANLPAFIRWAETHLQLDGLQFLPTPEAGLGVFAAKDIDQNDVLLKGSMNYTLSRTDTKQLLKDCIPENRLMAIKGKYEHNWQDNLWISLRLVVERSRKDSVFKPYLDCLPGEFVHPLFFNLTDFDALTGSFAHTNTIGVLHDVFLQYAASYEQLADNLEACAIESLTPETLTLDKYLWAAANTFARLFNDENGADVRLIPIHDLMNHKSDVEMSKFTATGTSADSIFTLMPSKPLKQGTELFYDYAGNSTTRNMFLICWGIVATDVPFYVRCALYPIDENYAAKLKLLTRFKFSTKKYLKFFPHLRPIPLSDRDFLFLLIVSTGLSDRTKLSASTWKKCWKYLISAINDELATYPQTLEESIQLRNNNKEMSANTHLAVKYVIAEKKAFFNAIKTAKTLADNFTKLKKNEL